MVQDLVRRYAVKNGNFVDPFCGSGRSLVCARLAGMRCLGIDLNPIALLISSSQLEPLDIGDLENKADSILDCFTCKELPRLSRVPNFFNRDYWFSHRASKAIWNLMRSISSVSPDGPVKDFFYSTLSEAIRLLSWSRNSEYKLYRVPNPISEGPEPLRVFARLVRRNIDTMKEYLNHCSTGSLPFRLLRLDSRNFDRHETFRAFFSGSKADLVVTSPPYGDARTTVSYGGFSRFAIQWLSMDSNFANRWGLVESEAIDLNGKLLGGKVQRSSGLSTPALDACILDISRLDVSRARKVQQFFEDIRDSLDSVRRIMSSRGVACLVLGNRTVKGIQVPTDEIVCQICSANDLALLERFERRIEGKRLPYAVNTNSKLVKQVKTMSDETVLAFRRRS